jgi:ABC-type uncharacterized transport system permease subunit
VIKWWVICDDHTMGPYRDEATAARRMAAIDPGKCGLPHEVRVSERRPEPAWSQCWDDGWAEDHEEPA